MPAFDWRNLRSPTAAILGLLLFVAYDRWREGATFYIPGIGTRHLPTLPDQK
jgi:hypothetical protein